MDAYEAISLIINGIIALTGFSAIIIYILQQCDKKRTAATLVVTQIDSIEAGIAHLKSMDKVSEGNVYQSRKLLAHNYWAEYRHLLSRLLGESNVRIIEGFYTQAEEIEKAREAICQEVVDTWKNKDLVYQNLLAQEIISTGSFDDKNSPIEKFGKYGSGFTARLPSAMLEKSLANFNTISGTVAYDKLLKKSYHR